MPKRSMDQGVLARLTERLHELGAVAWLCIYPVGCTLLGQVTLLGLDQGREVLVAIAEVQGPAWAWFFAGVVAWALSAWYCARVLLSSPIARGRLAERPSAFVRWLRVWLPRLLGAAAIFPLAVKFIVLTRSWFPALPLLLLGVAFWVAVVMRRPWMNWLSVHDLARRWLSASGRALLRLNPVAQIDKRIRLSTVAVCVISLALSFLLFLWFVLSPVEAPRRIGAAAIALLAISSWIVFGSIVLVLWPKAKGLPSLALLPLLTMALASIWNDNHTVRPLPGVAAAAPECFEKECVAREFVDWVRARKPRPDGKLPVFIVAASGGGQRAAHWTAQALALLNDATHGEFSRQIFAISAVSGGSLGAATFTALLAQRPRVAPRAMVECSAQFLSQDFLSPALAYLLFPDLLQQVFIPFPVPAFDRARALEQSWAQSWSQLVGEKQANSFAAPFQELWSEERRRRVPALFFDATVVETGQRMIVSSIPAGRDEFTDIVSAFDPRLDTWPISLAAAVHLSARFTVFSPAATLRDARSGRTWGRVVDGGYHESSGALTAAEIVRAIEKTVERGEVPADRVKLFALIITSSSNEPHLCGESVREAPVRFLHEARTPLVAMFKTREARGNYSRVALALAAQRVAGAKTECDCFAGGWCNTFEITMPAVEEQPAFGWFLSARSRRAMDDAMRQGDNREALKRIVSAVTRRAAPDAVFQNKAVDAVSSCPAGLP